MSIDAPECGIDMEREDMASPVSSAGSLFDDHENAEVIASRTPPPIPGLSVFPGLLPRELASELGCSSSLTPTMLFSAPPPAPSSMPSHIQSLDSALIQLLDPLLPPNVLETALRQPLARQAILNLYPPGQGISPHVDLPRRYADGIVGVSLTGGCVLTLQRADDAMKETGYGAATGERYDVYLPPRSVHSRRLDDLGVDLARLGAGLDLLHLLLLDRYGSLAHRRILRIVAQREEVLRPHPRSKEAREEDDGDGARAARIDLLDAGRPRPRSTRQSQINCGGGHTAPYVERAHDAAVEEGGGTGDPVPNTQELREPSAAARRDRREHNAAPRRQALRHCGRGHAAAPGAAEETVERGEEEVEQEGGHGGHDELRNAAGD
ncbi:hypothetical protein A1Q1_05911 [Trichosporon asahii var. asahii CBS 2479]|uniref:Fe2OG dioxygenase domain-containing protein n=1 Tax=Trichosporon asahii var. asahii (strain ATCC 90039 / CBS 2479 / JCM 2466 / KCTC 7840 / NBRC 103889/ NCYC 2677 / UAMH 7654) TaxID=1186058 RepID=J6ESN8_TRIAS|nr:hypothetical protein A1Q1_05911 [Trichosporon asahii var. asahii CBS 2479]EJT45762.1 hypothetical protein A1Q1_05911 [Trichosporon asahii var. asahii CBS 2479]